MSKKALIIIISLIILVTVIALVLPNNQNGNSNNSNNNNNNIEEKENNNYYCDIKVNFSDKVHEYYGDVKFEIISRYYFEFVKDGVVNNSYSDITYVFPNIDEYNKLTIPNGDYTIIENSKELTKTMRKMLIYGYEELKNMNINQYLDYLKQQGMNCIPIK